MARKTIGNIIGELVASQNAKGKAAGTKLRNLHKQWTSDPYRHRRIFFEFFDLFNSYKNIDLNNWLGYKTQKGKWMGRAFEEYVYKLLKNQNGYIIGSYGLDLLWAKKVIVWEGYQIISGEFKRRPFSMAIDVTVSKKVHGINVPFIAIECKSLLKLDYFRESVFKFYLLKKAIPQSKSYIAFTSLDMKEEILPLARELDDMFNLRENGEIQRLVKRIKEDIVENFGQTCNTPQLSLLFED